MHNFGPIIKNKFLNLAFSADNTCSIYLSCQLPDISKNPLIGYPIWCELPSMRFTEY